MSTSEFCFGQVDAGLLSQLPVHQSIEYILYCDLSFLNEVAFIPGNNKSNRNSKLHCWACLFNRLARLSAGTKSTMALLWQFQAGFLVLIHAATKYTYFSHLV